MTRQSRRLVSPLAVLALLGALAIALPMSAAHADPPAADMDILAAPNPVEINDYATITVTVNNGIPGENVTLEQKVGGLLWTQLGSAKQTDADNQVQWTQHWALLGHFQYRAKVSANANHAAGTSSTLTLNVQTTVDPPPPSGTFDCDGATPAVSHPGGGSWACTFNDEFSGSTLDTTYWSVANAGLMTQPKVDPACFGNGSDNVSVSGGYLHLSATVKAASTPCPGNAKKSSRKFGAQIWHNNPQGTEPSLYQTYGYYEVKAKLPSFHGSQIGHAGTDPQTYPTDTTKGLQETFWLWPRTDAYGPWPSSGEMDFAEFYSAAGNIAAPIAHYGFYQSSTGSGWKNANCNIDNPGADNVYKFLWEPGQLTMWVNDDSTPCLDFSFTGKPFDQPFYLILTQAFGVDMTTPDQAADNSYTPGPGAYTVGTTDVDYVRVWQ